MNGQRNNQSFRAVDPGHSRSPRRLGQHGDNVETIFDHGNVDDTVRNRSAGQHIIQRYANNFFFNKPGHYNISLDNGVFPGHPQTNPGMPTRNVPAGNGVSPITSAATFDLFGTNATGTLAQKRGRPTFTTTKHGNEPTLTSIERPELVNSPVTPNGSNTN